METVCSNKFRNRLQGERYEEINLHALLKPTSKSKLAKGIGTCYRNLISCLIMKRIKDLRLQTKYSFIHIPKNFNAKEAAEEINQMITSLKTFL